MLASIPSFGAVLTSVPPQSIQLFAANDITVPSAHIVEDVHLPGRYSCWYGGQVIKADAIMAHPTWFSMQVQQVQLSNKPGNITLMPSRP